ncbi:MAG: hypothetical protein F6K42_05435, partial [Leptolyngbya sp. SIO1D8]|nr:hypothetical protein [Leptolyngbya sp. SIO1D8]
MAKLCVPATTEFDDVYTREDFPTNTPERLALQLAHRNTLDETLQKRTASQIAEEVNKAFTHLEKPFTNPAVWKVVKNPSEKLSTIQGELNTQAMTKTATAVAAPQETVPETR